MLDGPLACDYEWLILLSFCPQHRRVGGGEACEVDGFNHKCLRCGSLCLCTSCGLLFGFVFFPFISFSLLSSFHTRKHQANKKPPIQGICCWSWSFLLCGRSVGWPVGWLVGRGRGFFLNYCVGGGEWWRLFKFIF